MAKPFTRRSLLSFAIAFLLALLIPFTLHSITPAQPSPSSPSPSLPNALKILPPPHPHPLPTTLTQWHPVNREDYFDQIQPVVVNYLVWSRFPVTVFVEPMQPADKASPFTIKRSQTWITAVQAAVRQWNPYLPLQLVDQAAGADISIGRSPPPLKLEKKVGTGASDRPSFSLPRARSAETRFELYAQPSASPSTPPLLNHRVTIYIRPDQAADYLQAAACHEMGHALGIWGHSPKQTDALYFSQVRNPAAISERDVNTLKRVYEQPTRLGWALQR